MLGASGICLEHDLTVSELLKEVNPPEEVLAFGSESVSEDESTSDEDEDVMEEIFLFEQRTSRLRPLSKDKIDTNLPFNSYEITFVSPRRYRRRNNGSFPLSRGFRGKVWTMPSSVSPRIAERCNYTSLSATCPPRLYTNYLILIFMLTISEFYRERCSQSICITMVPSRPTYFAPKSFAPNLSFRFSRQTLSPGAGI